MDCGLRQYRGRLSDEREPGHQFECGILQYRDLGGRRMAPKRQFGVRGQCSGCLGRRRRGAAAGLRRRLFERLPSGVRLTALGTTAVDLSRHLLREIEAAEEKMDAARSGRSGCFRMTAGPTWM